MTSETYYTTTAVERARREPPGTDFDTEIVVIGGGFAGLWVALDLARRGRDVVVLEANTLGEGASGRNGGFVSPGFSERLDILVPRVGSAHAEALWRLSQAGVTRIRQEIDAGAMPGVDPVGGRLTVYRHAGEDEATQAVERLRAWGTAAEVWPADHVRAVLASQRYHAAVHLPDGFHIHPLNLVHGLAAAIEAAGGRVFEQTAALDADLEGVRKTVTTTRNRIRAHEVVFCTSAPMRGFPWLARTLLPVATQVAVTAPMGEDLPAAIGFAGAIADTRRAGDYYRRIGDRLLWGGRISTRTAPPRALAAKLKADMLAVYPQLAAAQIEHAWTGVMGYAVHQMPMVGRLAPGVWVSTGFGGHGLAPTAIAGELISTALLDGDDRWRLFAPFGMVPAAGLFARLATQVGYWQMQWRDRREERAAQRRAKAAS